MKTVRIDKPHLLTQLADELFAAFPSWVTVTGNERSTEVTISGDGQRVTLTIPDADEAAARAVVEAHVPNPTAYTAKLRDAEAARMDLWLRAALRVLAVQLGVQPQDLIQAVRAEYRRLLDAAT